MVWKVIASSIKQQVQDINGTDHTLENDMYNIINGVMMAVGIVAVIVIIVGGVNYATSQGDPSKVTKGKKILIGGIVGLIIVLLAFAIVNFVLKAL